MLDELKYQLSLKRWNYNYGLHDWFFPEDVVRHSKKFKYMCRRLYSLGLLERDTGSPFGYTYRIPLDKL